MEPAIPDDSYCLIRRIDVPSSPERALLARYSGQVDSKTGVQGDVKLFRSDGKRIVLRSMSREYVDTEATDGVRVIGEAVCVAGT